MLTSRSRSTEAGPGENVALPRRVPGASQRDPGEAVPATAVESVPAELLDRDATAGDPDDRSSADLDDGALPDVSTLLARLVEERIPMALLVDLVNPMSPVTDEDDEVDRAPSGME